VARLKLVDGGFSNLDAEVIEPLRGFCRRDIDVKAAGWGAILPGKSIGDVLADIYDDLFAGARIETLPDKPQFVFDATNLQTGPPGQDTESAAGGLFNRRSSESKNASCRRGCRLQRFFRPVLSPVTISLSAADWRDRPGTAHFGDPHFTTQLFLTDGGAYDNLGLENRRHFFDDRRQRCWGTLLDGRRSEFALAKTGDARARHCDGSISRAAKALASRRMPGDRSALKN